MESLVGIQWFEILQSAGIVGSFLLTAYTIRKDSQARRISNLNTIADRHREIWREFYERPHLIRVLNPSVDLKSEPVTKDEEVFVNELIVHLDTVHRAIKAGMFVRLEGLKADIQQFFSLPIPQLVWKRSKSLQGPDFVAFVETALA